MAGSGGGRQSQDCPAEVRGDQQEKRGIDYLAVRFRASNLNPALASGNIGLKQNSTKTP